MKKQTKLVGIDSVNIDSLQDKNRPAHTILLGAEIPIVEHMCDIHLLPKEIESDKILLFSAVPAKVKNFGTFPVRAHAVLFEKTIFK